MTSEWTPWIGLKHLGATIARRTGYCALAWVVLYFCTQWISTGYVAPLFGLVIGALAGLTIGWVMGETTDEAVVTGFWLWALLVLGAWAAMWVPEGLLHLITGWSPGFGRWMLLTTATCFALASVMLRASAES